MALHPANRAYPISRLVQRLAGIRRRERNARRWRLKCFQMDLRGDWSSTCPVLLRDPRRNLVAPVLSAATAIISYGAGRNGIKPWREICDDAASSAPDDASCLS